MNLSGAISYSALGAAFVLIPLAFSNRTHTINLDGDLKTQLTPEERDILWRGKYPNEPDWFAGDPGQSTVLLGYDFTDAENPFGTCDITFVNANGNRPMPFQSTLNGAFPHILLKDTANLTVHFDVRFRDFTSQLPTSFMRTAAVIALMDDAGTRYYFERDIKDTSSARAVMPFVSTDVWEEIFANVINDVWVHLDIAFEDFIKRMNKWSEFSSFFVESCYLVNECFDSGHVAYDVKNWWLTTGY